MKALRLVPKNTAIDFIGKRFIAFAVSAMLSLGSIGSLAVQGLNFGIDFAGGVLIEIRAPEPRDIGDLRSGLNELGLGDVEIQEAGETGRDYIVRVPQQAGGEEAQLAAQQAVRGFLGEDVEYRRVELVGPAVGQELIVDGVLAVSLAILAIMAYIWLRFEWHFAVGATTALIHDVITTVGLFAILQLEFNLATVAAVLTIAGYSINDTVVLYDRVRDNLRKYKKMPLPDLLNLSNNEVLARTLLTSLTTLLALVSILIFGGDVLRGFAVAMIWGVVIGTYSTIYVAMPMLIVLNLRASQLDHSGDDPYARAGQTAAGDAEGDDGNGDGDGNSGPGQGSANADDASPKAGETSKA